MGRIRFVILVGMIAVWTLMAACATTPKGMAEGKAMAPKVELARVEVASYFPYDPKIRVPLILAFIFKMDNPNDF